MRVRRPGRRPRRRRDRCAQLSPRRRPRDPPRRDRAVRTPTRPRARLRWRPSIGGRDVTLHGDDDTPDRYGRQTAFVFVAGSETPVQSELLRRGEALVCRRRGRQGLRRNPRRRRGRRRGEAKMGIWADPTAIKNAESPGDILAGIGRFTVVEGKVLSVRQAGATTYLNFGRNWTRDFAATISRRMIPAFEAAGLSPKSLENRTDSCPRLCRVAGRTADRSAPGGAD